MRIKRLFIHGFKSFVDRVTFNFPTGTSAIVGPNGCGKSNIVDAIKWVLGEQNARHLRGRVMEDIIFNGSETRKPLGMAEVVLTLANEDGLAPSRYAGFTEIEVARRLYRSGESEYYINKIQVRLRDIVDLFTDTGIGTRSYSIIEQGQIGWLINAKPEERRAIFEEAAGINKFKQRKESALRKLEATRENLIRVNDIISEVKRQLNSLNRQAKKAERYKTLKEELKGIELYLSSIEYRELVERGRAKGAEIDSLEDRELALANDLRTKERMIEEVNIECMKEEEGFKGVKRASAEVERAIHEAERRREIAGIRIEELKRNEHRLVHEIEDLRAQRIGTEKEISGLRDSLEDMKAGLDEERRALAESTSMLDGVVEELKGREALLKTEKTELLGLTTRLADVRYAIQGYMKEEGAIRVREARLLKRREEVSESLDEKRQPVGSMEEELKGSIRKKESLEAELKRLGSVVEELERRIAIKEAELRDLKNEYSKVSSRLSALEEMERNYEHLKEGVRNILLKEDRNGIHGLIADVIEANPGYERAVETVLGDRLQYVIVESQKEGVEAIEYLKTHSSGRGSFVPVRDARFFDSPSTYGTGHPEGARALLSEIRVKEGYGAVVDFLLGDVIVVDDLRRAVSIWQNNHIKKTIVTLDGEMIDPYGVITGGNSNGSDGGILQKRGEIKRLAVRAEGLRERIKALEEELQDLKTTMDDEGSELERYRQDLHEEELRRVSIEGELRIHREDMARLEDTKKGLAEELDEIERTLREISSRKMELSRERDGLEERIREREERIKVMEEGVADLTGRKERISQGVTEKRVFIASQEERMESLKNLIEERKRLVDDIDYRIRTKEGEIEKGREEISVRRDEVDGIERELKGLLDRKDVLKRDEIERTERLFELTERLKKLNEDVKALNSRLAGLRDEKARRSVELKELELTTEHLRERIIDAYGVDLREYTPEDELKTRDLNELKSRREELKNRISSLGEVSLSALEEYTELEKRYNFLVEQRDDLDRSIDSLLTAINRINRTTRERFSATFDEINQRFKEIFPRFFNGGRAEIRLTEDRDILEAGIDIVAQPPGKRLQNINLLSGGEKALTVIALIFSIFLIKPTPFCLLDEVDAPLDDANIDRFNAFVKDLAKKSQFILITHNKRTMEMADTLYGITMEEPGISKVISVRL